MKRLLNFIATLIVIMSCSTSDGNLNKSTSKQPFVINNYWINQNYLDCLNHMLISDCIEKNEFYAFRLDSLRGIEIYDNPIESYYASIFKENDSFYFLKQGDTMEINMDVSKKRISIGSSIFISDERWNQFEDYNFIESISGLKIYQSLPVTIRQEINQEHVSISWNSRLNLHILSDSSSCESNKVIEYKRDSVFLYKVLNSCSPKSINDKIEKILILKAKK